MKEGKRKERVLGYDGSATTREQVRREMSRLLTDYVTKNPQAPLVVEHGTATLRKSARRLTGGVRILSVAQASACPWIALRQKWAQRRMLGKCLAPLKGSPESRGSMMRAMDDRALAARMLTRVDVLEAACRALLAGRPPATSPEETIARLVAVVSAPDREGGAPCSGCPCLAKGTATTSSRGHTQAARKLRNGDRRA